MGFLNKIFSKLSPFSSTKKRRHRKNKSRRHRHKRTRRHMRGG